MTLQLLESLVLGLLFSMTGLGCMNDMPWLTSTDGHILVLFSWLSPVGRARPYCQAHPGLVATGLRKGPHYGLFCPVSPDLLQEEGCVDPPANPRMDGRWCSWLREANPFKLFCRVQVHPSLRWLHKIWLGSWKNHSGIIGHNSVVCLVKALLLSR